MKKDINLLWTASLSDHQHTILKSITSNFKAKIPYAEFALIIGKEIWIMRLELSKESYYLFQTDGKEYKIIMDIFDNYHKTHPKPLAMEMAISTHIKNSHF